MKDPSTLHLEDPDQFTKRWQVACLGAMPWTAIEAKVSAEERSEAWDKCQGFAGHPKILDEFASELSRVGVVGERRATQLIYLAVTSRLRTDRFRSRSRGHPRAASHSSIDYHVEADAHYYSVPHPAPMSSRDAIIACIGRSDFLIIAGRRR